VIDQALDDLKACRVYDEDYAKTLDAVQRLYKIRDEGRRDRVSLDTAVIAVTNLLGIWMIIRHEHMNVITSRAMNLVLKPK
jgi:hypothetical protein